MPIIKSAKKKLRQDRKRAVSNLAYEKAYKSAIKAIKSGKNQKKTLEEAFSKIDKAAKKGVIHKNKANRLKSEISKFLSKGKKVAK